MSRNLVKKIEEIAWHRNGVSGEGFHVIRFIAEVEENSQEEAKIWGGPAEEPVKDAHWLAILFDAPGQCAVICLDLIPTRGVKFAGGNSWRGDHYEPELRQAIETMLRIAAPFPS